MQLLELICQYIILGYTHVIPLGFDHILFILTLYFFNSSSKSVILQCTLFTVAHSISLGFAASGFFIPMPGIVEPLIALSIFATSIENIVQSKMGKYRLSIIFIFGLVHGLGFATALQENGLPQNNFLTALFSFNLGVEFGQVTILLLAHYLIGKWFQKKEWYLQIIAYPISSIIACISLYWTIQRILFTNIL